MKSGVATRLPFSFVNIAWPWYSFVVGTTFRTRRKAMFFSGWTSASLSQASLLAVTMRMPPKIKTIQWNDLSKAAPARMKKKRITRAPMMPQVTPAVIENGQGVVTEHTAALALQRSLLPTVLTAPEGVSIAARYIPAAGDLGGDWYDVFELPDGRLGLGMGEVGGHGLEAAIVMGRLRSSLRAYRT